jgi:hypothetical protein
MLLRLGVEDLRFFLSQPTGDLGEFFSPLLSSLLRRRDLDLLLLFDFLLSLERLFFLLLEGSFSALGLDDSAALGDGTSSVSTTSSTILGS